MVLLPLRVLSRCRMSVRCSWLRTFSQKTPCEESHHSSTPVTSGFSGPRSNSAPYQKQMPAQQSEGRRVWAILAPQLPTEHTPESSPLVVADGLSLTWTAWLGETTKAKHGQGPKHEAMEDEHGAVFARQSSATTDTSDSVSRGWVTRRLVGRRPFGRSVDNVSRSSRGSRAGQPRCASDTPTTQQTTAAHQKHQICCKMCVPALAGVIEHQSANAVCSGDASTVPMMRSCVSGRGPRTRLHLAVPRCDAAALMLYWCYPQGPLQSLVSAC